jgi:hypothetical protein
MADLLLVRIQGESAVRVGSWGHAHPIRQEDAITKDPKEQ